MNDLREDEALDLFRIRSSTGRWGAADQQGTLNFISAETRRAALQTVRTGECVSLSADVRTAAIAEPGTPGFEHDMLYSWSPITCGDRIAFKVHGGAVTHIDCLGHEFFDGMAYNGRTSADIVSRAGLEFADVHALGGGIVTRGVLLDLEEQVPQVWPEGRALPSHLDECAEREGIDIRSGDALIVDLGAQSHAPACGSACTPVSARPAFPGCTRSRSPSTLGTASSTCHLATTGCRFRCIRLALRRWDSCWWTTADWTSWLRTAGQPGSTTSCSLIGPLRLKGATGSPVNPLCIL